MINPAALSLGTEGLHVHATGAISLDYIAVDRRLVDPDTGELIPGLDARTTLLSPSAAVGLYKVGARFSAGVQLGVPGSEELVDGGDDLAYHSRGGHHREYALVAGGAYRWRGLAFGASMRLVQTRVRLRFARDTALDSGRNDVDGIYSDCAGAPCGFENPAAREVYEIEAATTALPSTNTIAVTFGGVAEVAPDWWVGIGAHIPQGLTGSSVSASGTVSVQRAPRDGGEVIEGETTVRFSLPVRVRAGVRGRLNELVDLVGELHWDNTSVFGLYDVRLYGLPLADADIPEVYPRPRGLRDQVGVQLGVEQVDHGQPLSFGGRIGFERGATAPDRLSPLQIFPASLTADVGVQLRLGGSWVLQAGYGVAWAPKTDSARGAYDPIDRLDCIDSGFDIDSEACRMVRTGYALPTASGEYQRIDNVFRLGLRWDAP